MDVGKEIRVETDDANRLATAVETYRTIYFATYSAISSATDAASKDATQAAVTEIAQELAEDAQIETLF